MIGIIDYGMGNLKSVYHAIKALGKEVAICQQPAELKTFHALILPGVGAFQQSMHSLTQLGFVDGLNEAVLIEKKPILGICLGMQVMAKKGHEGGKDIQGLGWFDAEVIKLSPQNKQLRIPHVGWNTVYFKEKHPLFSKIEQHNADFYFVHSYHMHCAESENVIGQFHYDEAVTAAVGKDNILAVQFHPEKSQDYGLQLLENFINLSA